MVNEFSTRENEADTLSALPATRSSFIAKWTAVNGAAGYRLDVAKDPSFQTYVTRHRNLDAGNTTTRAITGLESNTTYYYRVAPTMRTVLPTAIQPS
jgi:phosphodiesterase/alkaline phosphatase D-like protein